MAPQHDREPETLTPKWHSDAAFQRNTNGGLKANLFNAIKVLRHAPEFHGVLGFDEFTGRAVARKKTTWGGPGAWCDNDDRHACARIQAHGVDVSTDVAAQAVQTIALEHKFNPVREWLESLKWDGTLRLGTWLRDYLGVKDTLYARAVGQCWLISGVARIFKPGCKVDTCLILEGPQGIGKSRALKTMGGDYFTDEISDLGSKDAAMQVQGVWIVELSELDSMSKPEAGKIKAFMSRSVDRFRPAYGRRVEERLRQCIFAGTVNHQNYLKDETGGRRFWPVKCSVIDLEGLAANRDQLWAEAVNRLDSGEQWWLPKELEQDAADEAADRYEGDPWDDSLAKWTSCLQSKDLSVSEALEHSIGMAKSQWKQTDRNRVARWLKSNGWERYCASAGTSSSGTTCGRRVREWRYRLE
jgi:predicted P-loop ATPase